MSTPIGSNNIFLSSITSVVQVVSPSSNTRGLELRTGIIVSGSVGGLNLYTGPTAPTGHGDHGPPVIFLGGSSATTTFFLPYPLSLPAGYGLWATASSGSTSAILLTWDLLA